jgi:hypothetical protein
MGVNFNEKSQLKTDVIKKVLLNEKDYTFGDFKFKVLKDIIPKLPRFYGYKTNFIEVYNFDTLILKLEYNRVLYNQNALRFKKKADNAPPDLVNKFRWSVKYFNPQTNNDCQSINHIIAVFKEFLEEDEKHSDRGNASVINNQYAFRKKTNYYSFTRVWGRGDIFEDNFDKDLSYEFATEEYINYLKRIYGFKRMPRRDLKNSIKEEIGNAVGTEKKRMLAHSLKK